MLDLICICYRKFWSNKPLKTSLNYLLLIIYALVPTVLLDFVLFVDNVFLYFDMFKLCGLRYSRLRYIRCFKIFCWCQYIYIASLVFIALCPTCDSSGIFIIYCKELFSLNFFFGFLVFFLKLVSVPQSWNSPQYPVCCVCYALYLHAYIIFLLWFLFIFFFCNNSNRTFWIINWFLFWFV